MKVFDLTVKEFQPRMGVKYTCVCRLRYISCEYVTEAKSDFFFWLKYREIKAINSRLLIGIQGQCEERWFVVTENSKARSITWPFDCGKWKDISVKEFDLEIKSCKKKNNHMDTFWNKKKMENHLSHMNDCNVIIFFLLFLLNRIK